MSDDRTGLEPVFPYEFLVEGTPVSVQSSPTSKNRWMQQVKEASSLGLQEGHWAHTGRVTVTLYYFPPERMDGDIDNIVKPIIDAMAKHIYLDDHQVERVVVQKFEPGNAFPFRAPSATLVKAMLAKKPVLYVRVSDDPFEDLP